MKPGSATLGAHAERDRAQSRRTTMDQAHRRLYRDIFGIGSAASARFIEDYGRLQEIVASLKTIDPEVKIVLVLGTYDLLHIGHARYLEQCREHGDVVIVAVDPDEMVKNRKGPNRPVVPQEERVEMLTHLRHVDLVTLVTDYDAEGLWTYKLISDYLHPDVVVISHREPTDEEHIATVKKYCGEVVILPSQAQTSTSAKIRLLMVDFARTIKETIEGMDIPGVLTKAIDAQLDGPESSRPEKTADVSLKTGQATTLAIPEAKKLEREPTNEEVAPTDPGKRASRTW